MLNGLKTGIWIFVCAVVVTGLLVSIGLVQDCTGIQNSVLRAEQSSNASPDNKPLLHAMAPSFFPIDFATGKINLPKEITTVIIDVGARESDYLQAIEQLKDDTTTALIMVDPLPESYLPLQKRAAEYGLRQSDGRNLNAKYRDRIFVLPGAMGLEEGWVEFNLSHGPACGSILQTAENNTFWCANTRGKMTVQVFTLKDLLDLIPERETIESMHLKVDTEGADLIALQGGGSAIQRFDTIIIECQNISPEEVSRFFRKDECLFQDATKYMCEQHNICDGIFEKQGSKEDPTGQGNVFFTNRPRKVPAYLKTVPVTFRDWYRSIPSPNATLK